MKTFSRQFWFGVVAIALVFCFSSLTSAHAETTDDIWQFTAGAVQGITSDGQSYSRLDTVLENPSGDALFGIAPNGAWYEIVYVNDEIEFFNQARIFYDLGDSDNFKISALYLNQPYEATGIGVNYIPTHWGMDWLYNVNMSAWIMEGSGYTLALDGMYDFAEGYGLKVNMLAGLTSGLDKDYIDGRVSIYHNLYPDGSMFIEVGYEDRRDIGHAYFAVGGSI